MFTIVPTVNACIHRGCAWLAKESCAAFLVAALVLLVCRASRRELTPVMKNLDSGTRPLGPRVSE